MLITEPYNINICAGGKAVIMMFLEKKSTVIVVLFELDLDVYCPPVIQQ